MNWQATTGAYSPSYRAHMVSNVRNYFAWLVDQEVIDVDPTTKLAKVRQPRSVPRAMDMGQLALLGPTVKGRPRESAIVALMYQLGLRCVEVARLDLADWDRDHQTLFIVGKGGHERVLPVTPVAQYWLEQWLKYRGGRPGPLIVGYSPRSPADGRVTAGWVSTHIAKLMAEAGLHTKGDGRTAHALRHTAASDVLEKAKDLRVVQQMLGHASLRSTEVYLRRADLGSLREAMDGRSFRRDQEGDSA